MISVKDLHFRYHNKPESPVLKGVTFDLTPGSVTVVIGLSGSGKSTLCQILSGIIPNCIPEDYTGQVLIDDEDISKFKLSGIVQKIGYVMQDPDRQIIASTVEDELAFGLENLEVEPELIRSRVDDMMDFLKIRDMALVNPSRLSGGQKQLLSIGSVLIMEPEVLILDEPFSHLDDDGKYLTQKFLKKMQKEGKTILIVEHNYYEADFVDKWLELKDGRINELEPIHEFAEETFAEGTIAI